MQTRTTPVLARVRDIWKKIPPVKQLVKKLSFRTAAFAFLLLTYFWKRSSSRTSKHEPEKGVDVIEPPSNLNMDEFIAKRKDTDEQDDWGQYVDMSSVRYVETPRKTEEEPATCWCVWPCVCMRMCNVHKFNYWCVLQFWNAQAQCVLQFWRISTIRSVCIHAWIVHVNLLGMQCDYRI